MKHQGNQPPVGIVAPLMGGLMGALIAASIASGCKGKDANDKPASEGKTLAADTAQPSSATGAGSQSLAFDANPTAEAPSGVLDLSTQSLGDGKFELHSKHYRLTMSGKPTISAQNTVTPSGQSVPGAMALVSNGEISADGFSYTIIPDDKSFDIGNATKEVRQGMLTAVKATVVKDTQATFGPVSGTYVKATAQQHGQEVDLHVWLAADKVAMRIVGIIAIRASGDLSGVNELRDSFRSR